MPASIIFNQEEVKDLANRHYKELSQKQTHKIGQLTILSVALAPTIIGSIIALVLRAREKDKLAKGQRSFQEMFVIAYEELKTKKTTPIIKAEEITDLSTKIIHHRNEAMSNKTNFKFEDQFNRYLAKVVMLNDQELLDQLKKIPAESGNKIITDQAIDMQLIFDRIKASEELVN
jgi:hypothetical protein